MTARHMGTRDINIFLRWKSASGHVTSYHHHLLSVQASPMAALGRSAMDMKESGIGPLAHGLRFSHPWPIRKCWYFSPLQLTECKNSKRQSLKPRPSHPRQAWPPRAVPLPTLPSITCSSEQRQPHYTARSSDLALQLLDLLALLKRRVSTSSGGSCISTVVQAAETERSSDSSSSPSTSHLLPLAPLRLVLLPLLAAATGGPAGGGSSCSNGSSCWGRGCRTLLGVEEPAELEGTFPCCSAAMLTQFCSAARAWLLLLK